MAFVAPLIVGAVGLTGAAALAATAVIDIGLAVGLSYVAKRLQASSSSTSNADLATQLSLRATINESREVAAGICASAGSLKYWHTYGPNGADYLQMVFQLADHECDGIDNNFFVDGVARTLGSRISNGTVSGRPVSGFESNMWVEFHTGAWDQDADEDLVAQNEDYSSDSRGRGCCYARVTMLFDPKVFANGIPDFVFVFRGAKLYDWRLDSTAGGAGAHRWGSPATYEWTANPAVCLYNWHRGIFVNGDKLAGLGTPALALPLEYWTAAANACDEDVDLLAGGTEPRYRMGGIIPITEKDNSSVVKDMLATMAGVLVDSGGVFKPIAGVAQSPVFSDVSDDDLIANQPIEIAPKLSRSQLINRLFGSFSDPAQIYASQPLPPRISIEDQATDGGYDLSENYDLPLVQSGTQGQRVLEILRRKGRYQRRVSARFRSRFAVLESGDWITWTSARYGWTDMTFEVLTCTLNRDLTCDLTLREISASAFAWTPATDELDPADPAAVGAGGSTLTTVNVADLDAILVVSDGAAERPGLRVTWTPVTDGTVTSLRLQYRIASGGGGEIFEQTILEPSAGQYSWVDSVQGNTVYEARLMPITVPARATTWSGWHSSGTTDPQTVEVAALAEAVPPGSITPEMLDAQSRFELGLVTAVDTVMGSVSEISKRVKSQAENAAQATIESLLQGHSNKAAIRIEQTLRQTADESLASQITTLSAEFDTATGELEAAIVAEQTARADADSAMATDITALYAAVSTEAGARSAAITAEQTARADADTALASDITAVETTVGGHTTSISEILTSVDGLGARWGIAIDVDGNIVGAVQLDGTDDYSAFTVTADTFQVALPSDPDGDPVPVFVVAMVNGVAKLALRGDMIIDGAILARHLAVSTLSAITADLGTVTAGVIKSSDNKFKIDLNNKTLEITA